MVQNIIPENELDAKLMSVWKTVNGWGWSKFIPLKEFFEKFNVPDMTRLEDRMTNNFIYFRTNYLALYVLLLIIAALNAPIFALVDLCVFALWMIPFVSVPAPFSVGDYRVTPSCILAALSAFTLVILLIFRRYFGYFILINLLFVLLVGLHCAFRNSSLMSRMHVNLNEKNKLRKYID
ncbi:hypothetical protein WA577_001539 [Blastocystis sp. JDR]